MKKRITVLLFICSLVFLFGCDKNNEKSQEYFNGKIMEVKEDSLLVECLDVTSGVVPEGQQVYVTRETVSTECPSDLEVGDEIRVVFKSVLETDPLQLDTVFNILLLDSEGNVIEEKFCKKNTKWLVA